MPTSRHISELSRDPLRPLTQDELDHFEEYLTFKNDDISAKDVSLTHAVDHVIEYMDFYLGVPGAKRPDVYTLANLVYLVEENYLKPA